MRSIFEKALNFKILILVLKTRTAIQSSITTSATLLNGLLGVAFYILVARILGPAEFGILAVALASLTLIADIANVGTDTGIIRFVGKYLKEDKSKVFKFLKLGLEIKALAFLVVLTIGWLLIPQIAFLVFRNSSFIVPLQLSLLGVGSALAFSFISHAIQAHQKYTQWALLNIGQNSLRLLMIIVLLFLGLGDLETVLVTYITIPLLGFLVGLLFIPNFLFTKNEFSVASEFFHYNKWIALGSLIAATGARIDTFITAKLLSTTQVGIYAAANQLTVVVPQLVFAIATVAAPKLAGMGSRREAKLYLQKLQLLVIGLALTILIAIPISFWAIPYFYGPAYIQSIVPFSILLLGQLFFLLALPSHQAIYYYFGQPKLFVIISLFQLLIVSILSWVLIGRWGIIGSATAVLAGNIFLFTVPLIIVLDKFKKNE